MAGTGGDCAGWCCARLAQIKKFARDGVAWNALRRLGLWRGRCRKVDKNPVRTTSFPGPEEVRLGPRGPRHVRRRRCADVGMRDKHEPPLKRVFLAPMPTAARTRGGSAAASG